MGVGFESLMCPGTQQLMKDSTTRTTCGGDAASISFCRFFFPFLAPKWIHADLKSNYWQIWVYLGIIWQIIQEGVCMNIGIVGVYVRLNNELWKCTVRICF